jgi:hypothetical protein
MGKTNEQVTCMDCGKTFVPSFRFDFYQDDTNPEVGRCERCMMAKEFAQPVLGEPSKLPLGYDENVCKKGRDELTCSFLGFAGTGFSCLKGSSFEFTILQKKAEGSMGSKGDNCSGPPDFTVK